MRGRDFTVQVTAEPFGPGTRYAFPAEKLLDLKLFAEHPDVFGFLMSKREGRITCYFFAVAPPAGRPPGSVHFPAAELFLGQNIQPWIGTSTPCCTPRNRRSAFAGSCSRGWDCRER